MTYIANPMPTLSQKSAAYTIVPSDQAIEFTAGTVACTLPAAVAGQVQQYTISNIGTGVITLTPAAGSTISGLATRPLSQYTTMRVRSSGINWVIV